MELPVDVVFPKDDVDDVVTPAQAPASGSAAAPRRFGPSMDDLLKSRFFNPDYTGDDYEHLRRYHPGRHAEKPGVGDIVEYAMLSPKMHPRERYNAARSTDHGEPR